MITDRYFAVRVLVGCLIAVGAYAHPVTFKDGIAVMTTYTKERFDSEVNYSYDSRHAIGLTTSSLVYNEDRITSEFLHFNYLVRRWNLSDAQANFYVWGGLGASELKSDTSLAALVATQLDYETRRIYTMLGVDSIVNDKGDFSRLRYRLGIAPYIAPYDGFHTWLIAEAKGQHSPNQEGEISLSPVVRFFYQNYLLEVGYNFGDSVMVSTIFHF